MYCYCKDWYNVPPISHFVPLYRWLVGDGHSPISILVINVQSLTASYQLWKTEKVKVYHHFKRIFTSEKDFTSDLEWETNVLSWSYTTTNIIFKMIIWQEISHLISWWYLQTETYTSIALQNVLDIKLTFQAWNTNQLHIHGIVLLFSKVLSNEKFKVQLFQV